MSRSMDLQPLYLIEDWYFKNPPLQVLHQKFTTVLKDEDLSDAEGSLCDGFRGRPLLPATAKASGASEVKTDDGFEVSLNVDEFEAGELDVKRYNGYVEVRGKHADKRDQHSLVCREFCRRYIVPDDCDISALTSDFSPDHILTLKAPLKGKVEKELNIPMKAAIDEMEFSPLVLEMSGDKNLMNLQKLLRMHYNNRIEASGEDIPASYLEKQPLFENTVRELLNKYRVTEEEFKLRGETVADEQAEPQGETVADKKAEPQGETVADKKGETVTDEQAGPQGETVADKKAEPQGETVSDEKGETLTDKKVELEGETLTYEIKNY